MPLKSPLNSIVLAAKCIILAVVAILLCGGMHLIASETYTNWNGLLVGLVVPRTNIVLGDQIIAGIVISNTVEDPRVVRWQTGDVCSCGFGTFDILEVSSGRKVECRFPKDERTVVGAGSIRLQPHKAHDFDINLMAGYDITNAGSYSVRAIRLFPISEPPTNHQYATVETPPIIVWISSKTETNSPAK